MANYIKLKTECEVIDNDILKECPLPMKQIAKLLECKADRLYSINRKTGKAQLTVEEYNKLVYINEQLEKLEKEMKEW